MMRKAAQLRSESWLKGEMLKWLLHVATTHAAQKWRVWQLKLQLRLALRSDGWKGSVMKAESKQQRVTDATDVWYTKRISKMQTHKKIL